LYDFYDEPEGIRELLDICLETGIRCAKAQIEAGANIIGMGDAVASLIGQKFYMEYAYEYEKKLIAAVHDMGALAKLHICGNIDPVRIIKDGTPEIIRQAVRDCLDGGNETSIISSGCEIPLGTPHENLMAVHQALAEYGG